MKAPRRLLLTIPALAIAYFFAINIIAGTSDNQPFISSAPTPSQSVSVTPGTGLFAAIAVDVELSADEEENIDAFSFDLKTIDKESGCTSASEVMYLGRGGEDIQIGILYRCSKAQWDSSGAASHPLAKVVLSNETEVIVFSGNPEAPLEEVSPMEKEFNSLSKLFLRTDLYTFQ
jgi:hypothetical protein